MTTLQQKTIVDPSYFRVDAWEIDDDLLTIVFFNGYLDPNEDDINREVLEQDLIKRGIQPILDKLNPTITYQLMEDEVEYWATIKLDKDNLFDILPILSNLYQLQEYPWINDETEESIPLIKNVSFGYALGVNVGWDLRNRRLEINHLEADALIIYEDDDREEYEIYAEDPNDWRRMNVSSLLSLNGYGEYDTTYELLVDKTIQYGEFDVYGLAEVWVDF